MARKPMTPSTRAKTPPKPTTANYLPPPRAVPTPQMGASTLDCANFQTMLQQALDDGRVLELNADVQLDEPAFVVIRKSHQGWFGLDGRHHRITSRVRNAPALRVVMDGSTPQGTCARSMVFQDFSMVSDGNDIGCLQFEVPFNDRWIVNPTWRDIWIEGSGGFYGIDIVGSIFEGNLYSVGTMNCKQNGIHFGNAGQPGNVGVVSALRYFGGTHRQNGGNGLIVDAYDGPRDVRLYGLYFCENGNSGISMIAGTELIDGCGFENNHGGQGIYLENYGKIRGCSASTYGPQPRLLKGYIVSQMILDTCSVEGYGGGDAMLAEVSGDGTLIVQNSPDSVYANGPKVVMK